MIMLSIFFSGLWYANYYYQGVNSSEDPRVRRAKELYQKYNELAGEKKYQEIFVLLDSIHLVYNQYDDYQHSFEVGVLHNNRAAVLLNIALFEQVTTQERDSIIIISEAEIREGIRIYHQWNEEFSAMSKEELMSHFRPIYRSEFQLLEVSLVEDYIEKRTMEMVIAQKEIHRRLSVTYTNLGIVLRHQNQVEKAVECYELALELWSENLTAENNINILMGQALKERSLLDKIFPPNK